MIRQRYRLKEKLADAMFGSVCLCEDTQFADELVAIKQSSLEMSSALLAQHPNADNPWHERQAVMKLLALPPHPNVVAFRDQFLHNESWFVVMQYCRDGDLLAVVQRSPRRRLPEADALPLFRQVVRGLHFLHEHGIAHRDVSLENVLVHDGVCKLSDLGLATDARRWSAELVGKPYYTAPEVAAGDEYVPERADMWSLGIVLFIMLTGSPLVQVAAGEENDFAAFQQLGVHRVVQAWKMTAFVSVPACDLLAALLQSDPARRPTTAEVLAHPLLQRLPL